jgi:putative Mn2+ efflux pump MntP
LVSVVKLLALVLSLGLDTLAVSVGIGLSYFAARWRVALVFAAFEALMPLIGLAGGHWLGHLLGLWASAVGAVLLIGLGIYALWFEDEDDVGSAAVLSGWALLTAAASVSLDELAVGFSLALVQVPVFLTAALIAVQAFVVSWIGITFARQLRRWVGERIEKLGGVALLAIGLWQLLELWFHLH